MFKPAQAAQPASYNRADKEGGMVRSADGSHWMWMGLRRSAPARNRRAVSNKSLRRSEGPIDMYPAHNVSIQLYEADTCELDCFD